MSNARPKEATVEIRPRNADDFRAIAKSVQKALSFLCDPKASQFERILPGDLSDDDDDLCLGRPQLLCYMVPVTESSPGDRLNKK